MSGGKCKTEPAQTGSADRAVPGWWDCDTDNDTDTTTGSKDVMLLYDSPSLTWSNMFLIWHQFIGQDPSTDDPVSTKASHITYQGLQRKDQ